MDALKREIEEELKLRNFSNKTIKSYISETEKFLNFSKNKGLNEKTAREYFLKQLGNKNPTTVSHNISIISFFFDKILEFAPVAHTDRARVS